MKEISHSDFGSNVKPLDRRDFLKQSLLGATAVSLVTPRHSEAQAPERTVPVEATAEPPGIIDTNINLFEWPFRTLKYRDTKALAAKLRKHRVKEAWAGSFEALFAKDLSGVNERLAEECRTRAPGFLIPFGSVNLAWPDWEEDVRRCHEVHQMRGLRIYPGYQPFDLDHPDMVRLLTMVKERNLVLQVVFSMEDPRVHHPILRVGLVLFPPLVQAMKLVPEAKVQLLHFVPPVRGNDVLEFMSFPNTSIETSRLEGNGAIGRMIGSITGLPSARVPVERVTFGSHAPFFPLETALLKLVESPLDVQQLEAIMWRNARRLLPRA